MSSVAHYIADGAEAPIDNWGWRNKALPAIHMPRNVSRITLEVMSTRVERLGECSEEDAIAEGVEPIVHESWSVWDPACGATVSLMVEPSAADVERHRYESVRHIGPQTIATAREMYRSLWDSINGAGSAAQNPWVFVVTFRAIEASMRDPLMRHRPVIFSAPMIRALLAGKKTQTRRLIKGMPTNAENVRLLGPLLKWAAAPDSPSVSERRDNPWFNSTLWVREGVRRNT